MRAIINKLVEKEARKRSMWIDNTIFKNLPKWKVDLIKKSRSRLVAKLLGVNIEIEHHPLLMGFGYKIVIKLNGKIIGKRMYK